MSVISYTINCISKSEYYKLLSNTLKRCKYLVCKLKGAFLKLHCVRKHPDLSIGPLKS